MNSSALSAVSTADSKLDFPLPDASNASDSQDPFYHFVFTTTTTTPPQDWVMDSGATCCATSSEADCVDVRECNVNVIAAGSTFPVRRIGTAVINAIDERGQNVQLRMHNTLISERFPYKLLALQLFTSKGCQIIMGKQNMRIVSEKTDTVFVGYKDAKTQLFFLQQLASPSQKSCIKTPTLSCASTSSSPHSFLARSYGSDSDLL